MIHKAETPLLPRLLLVGVASVSIAIGASAAVSASTGTTEPADDTTADTMAGHTMDSAPASLAVDGSAEASSPEAEAFCAAELAAEAASRSEDPAAIGPAFEALGAAAPAEVAPAVDQLIASAEAGGPEFDEAYATVIEYLRANCGFAELSLTGGDYFFEGVPAELPAGPIIVSIENTGEELHVIEFARINDDVTLTKDELLALPEEEAFTMINIVGSAFAAPGTTGYGVMDLTPGRYLAVCPLPQGLTPEVAAQFEEPVGSAPEGSAPEGSAPMGSEPMGSEPMGTEPMGTEPMGTEPMGTEPMGSEPMGSAPAGSAPAGSGPGGPELGPPHFLLGMVQEVTVI